MMSECPCDDETGGGEQEWLQIKAVFPRALSFTRGHTLVFSEGKAQDDL